MSNQIQEKIKWDFFVLRTKEGKGTTICIAIAPQYIDVSAKYYLLYPEMTDKIAEYFRRFKIREITASIARRLIDLGLLGKVSDLRRN